MKRIIDIVRYVSEAAKAIAECFEVLRNHWPSGNPFKYEKNDANQGE